MAKNCRSQSCSLTFLLLFIPASSSSLNGETCSLEPGSLGSSPSCADSSALWYLTIHLTLQSLNCLTCKMGIMALDKVMAAKRLAQVLIAYKAFHKWKLVSLLQAILVSQSAYPVHLGAPEIIRGGTLREEQILDMQLESHAFYHSLSVLFVEKIESVWLQHVSF